MPYCLAQARQCHQNEDYAAELRWYQRVEALGVKDAELYYYMALLGKQLNKMAYVLEYTQKSLLCSPQQLQAYALLIAILKKIPDFPAIERWSQQVIRATPMYAGGYVNWGIGLWMQNRLHEATQVFRQALHINPSLGAAKFNLAQLLLAQGEWREGFALFEQRVFHASYQEQERFYQGVIGAAERWDGRLFSGKTLLIHQDMGLGDLLQFVRYLPQVKARGGQVVVAVKQPLLSLLRDNEGIDLIVEARPERLRDLSFDYYLPAMSLPYLFGTTLKTVPVNIPYIAAGALGLTQKFAFLQQEARYKVGLVWASDDKSSPRSPRHRNLPQRFLEPLLALPDVAWYSLQVGQAASEDSRWHNLAPLLETFADTAAVIDGLDLVITVDTAVAHLAGAMGKPVWVLLPFSPDWRWLLTRTDSVWYPTMRLFRQVVPGDWRQPVEEAAQNLMNVLAASGDKATTGNG